MGGNEDVVKVLLSKGAAVDATEANGTTPLHEAASRGYWQIVRLLVAGGASIAASENTGRTAIHYAAAANAERIVQFLLEQGEDDELTDNLGMDGVALGCDGGPRGGFKASFRTSWQCM